MDNRRNIRFIFYFLWVATILLQAYFVELRGDEAYYWMYSKHLAWGYFDHPPVTAVLVKAGYLLFQNELGVRLFFILLGAATIWIMEMMIRPTNLKLFYAIILSIGFLQIGMVFGGGMFAIPDFPLLFFAALFFYFYKQYLKDSSRKIVVLLSLVICFMLLSKYHGILIIGFTLFSNPALLRQKSFWLIVGLSTILFLPHLWWQYVHDLPSVRYHLYERSAREYSTTYTIEYLAGQPFILGPFIGILLIYIGFIFKPKDLFERSLKFLIVGTYIFFFLMTFKGRVEGNWTIITLVPLLYLGYNHITESERLKKITGYSFAISIVLILTVRILLISNFLPASLELTKSFRARQWSKELKKKSKGKPVGFINSYQKASQYEFYSGVPAFSINNVWGRKNQYSIWDSEAEFQGKDIVLVANYRLPENDSIQFYHEYFPYLFIDNFRSTSNVIIQSDLEQPVKVQPSDTLRLAIKFNYQNDNVRNLEGNKEYPSRIFYSYFQFSQAVEIRATDMILKDDMIGNDQIYSLIITAPSAPGEYDFYLGVSTGWLPPGINSERIKIIVE